MTPHEKLEKLQHDMKKLQTTKRAINGLAKMAMSQDTQVGLSYYKIIMADMIEIETDIADEITDAEFDIENC